MQQQYDRSNRGAVWLKQSPKTGLKYMGGELNVNGQDFFISVFKNDKKVQGSNQPDYNISITPKHQQQNIPQQNINNVQQQFQQQPVQDPWNDQQQPVPNTMSTAGTKEMYQQNQQQVNNDDSIPF